MLLSVGALFADLVRLEIELWDAVEARLRTDPPSPARLVAGLEQDANRYPITAPKLVDARLLNECPRGVCELGLGGFPVIVDQRVRVGESLVERASAPRESPLFRCGRRSIRRFRDLRELPSKMRGILTPRVVVQR